jgi:hypothetical protein
VSLLFENNNADFVVCQKSFQVHGIPFQLKGHKKGKMAVNTIARSESL